MVYIQFVEIGGLLKFSLVFAVMHRLYFYIKLYASVKVKNSIIMEKVQNNWDVQNFQHIADLLIVYNINKKVVEIIYIKLRIFTELNN